MDFVGIDKFSLLDYDGYVSAILFAPTCNFRCPFCHNGESVLSSKYRIPFEDIIQYLKSRQGVIDAVVISGGEPTLMDDLKEKIIALRSLGLKIKLDTNGTNPEVIQDLIENHLLDYVAMDIKNSASLYGLTSGTKNVPLEKIKQSISLLINSGIDYEFRTTLVEEFHSLSSIQQMGELIQGAKLLFLQKFVDREGVIQQGLHPVNEELAKQFQEVLSKFVNRVELRGY